MAGPLHSLHSLIKQCNQLNVAFKGPFSRWKGSNRRGGSGLNRNNWNSRLVADPCVFCGQPSNTLDHIRPLALGQKRIRPMIGGYGANDWPNRAPACVACNQKKANMGLLWFLLKQTI